MGLSAVKFLQLALILNLARRSSYDAGKPKRNQAHLLIDIESWVREKKEDANWIYDFICTQLKRWIKKSLLEPF